MMSYVLFHQELYSEVGELKRYSVNYDLDGRPKVLLDTPSLSHVAFPVVFLISRIKS
jgi:hypothetical protein